MGKLGWVAGAAIASIAAPAGADVKAGVDAWTRGDYRQAIEQWRGPAIAGDADAQFNLGQAYKLGRGVPVDPGLAESWFRKAALQNHPEAQDNYGLALFQADRKSDAAVWLEKSVARGEPRAQLVLGTMLFNGDGVPREPSRAYALMTRASDAGLQSASRTLAQMDAYITPADRQHGIELARQYVTQDTAVPVVQSDARATETRWAGSPSFHPVRARQMETTRLVTSPPLASAPSVRSASPLRPRLIEPKAVRSEVASATPAHVGRWRIQLGAFSTQANARTQWSRVQTRLGNAKPSYAKAGSVIRLQAGPFMGETEARRACANSHTACVIVAP